MSTSEEPADDFDGWVKAEFAARNAFTALVLLVKIGKRRISPLRSTYVHVIGDELDWGEITRLFSSAGVAWDGAAFFPEVAKGGGPLDNAAARLRLRMLETRVDDDRLALNDGHFFDAWGRRMRVDEIG